MKYEQSYDRLFEGEVLETNNAPSDNDSDDFMWYITFLLSKY